MNQNQQQFEKSIIDLFHLLYYFSPHTWNNGWTKWMGVPCFQNPLDLWVLQETIWETKPNLIVETGTALGGSALFFASVFDGMGEGKVISIDTQDGMKPMKEHPRVAFLKGISTEAGMVEKVRVECQEKRVMVILDSDHSIDNVLRELKIYSQFVSAGCYLIVDDTNLEGNPVYNPNSPGDPKKAVEMFMRENDEFEVDPSKEKFYLTFMPGGWLKKKPKMEEKDGK